MADFYQTGVVATFHRFGNVDLERMEGELTEFNRNNPIALVLPATYAELEAPAIKQIVKGVAEVTYLNEIVVTMGRTTRSNTVRQKSFFPVFLREHGSFGTPDRHSANSTGCLRTMVSTSGLMERDVPPGRHMVIFSPGGRAKSLPCMIVTSLTSPASCSGGSAIPSLHPTWTMSSVKAIMPG